MTYTPDAPLWRHLRRAAPDARYVCYALRTNTADRTVKVPIQPSGRRARTNDAATWRTWDAVVAAARDKDDVDGIGIVFDGTIDATTGAALVGIDGDAVVDRGAYTYRPMADAARRADTMAELSASGTGVHLYLHVIGGVHIDGPRGPGRAVQPLTDAPRHPWSGKRPAVELYVCDSYFACTGEALGAARPVRTVTYVEFVDIVRTVAPALAARVRPGPPPPRQHTPRRIPRAVWRALARDDRYASRSEREMAVIGGLINAGYTDAAVIAWVTGRPDDGRLHTPARMAAGTLTHTQAAAAIGAGCRKHRARGHTPAVANARRTVADALAAIDAAPVGTLTTRRAHETDRAVLRDILRRMAAAGTVTAAAVSTRDIALAIGAGVTQPTVTRAIRRLTAAGYVTVAARGTLTQAATYAVGPRLTAADSLRTEKHHLHPPVCVSDAFLSAGVSADCPQGVDADAGHAARMAAVATHPRIRAAAAAWRAMDRVMLTPSELAAALGCHVRTARRHIAALAAYGLCIGDGIAHTAVATPAVVDAAAERLGIGARRDALAARIMTERDGLRARRDARAAAERASAGKQLRARMGIGAENKMKHTTPNAPQGPYGPQTTPQGPTYHPDPNGGRTAHPDASAVTVAVTADGDAITASVTAADGGTAAATVAALGGLRAMADAVRPADAAPGADALAAIDAAGLFRHPVTVTP